ncbi:MAG TPA: YkgJ family cysteine cluster protein [Edaphocola sp.]|nr:YkgJ family cysteine cluster protein [Edaphocola sp.]
MLDVKNILKKAKREQQELTTFLQKFDHTIPDNLDKIVAEEDEKVWKEVNCLECANCCKTMTPIFTPEDIKRISKHLGMTEKAFFEKYLEIEEDTGSTVNKILPCQFLVDNKCSIYEVRPIDCAEFPHHNKVPFDDYNETFIQNVHRCPATYKLVKQLKARIEEEYDF